MAYKTQFLKVTHGGILGVGAGFDIWSISINIAPPAGSVTIPEPTLALATTLHNLYKTLHTDTVMDLSANALLSYTKLAVIDVDGHYLQDPIVYEPTTPSGGAHTTTAGSMVQSLVLSWWSGATLGGANYGRVYLPWFCGATGSDGRIGSTGSFATKAKTWIDGVNSAVATAMAPFTPAARVSIVSNVGLGNNKVVTKVRVGDVTDVQRRRKNALDENYSITTLA